MSQRALTRTIIGCCYVVASALAGPAANGQISVQYAEGVTHGFLVLRAKDGHVLAEGENAQTAKENVVTNRIIFRFKDGSVYEETTVFSQRGIFRLIKDHVVQKGPAFKFQMESTIEAQSGRVTIHYEKDGKPLELQKTLALPADLSNGLVFTLIKNILARPVTTVSYLALTPEPALVKLVFTKEAKEKLRAATTPQKGARFAMKVDIGGFRGFMASLLRKKPPDTQLWVLDEEAPSFVASEGPLYSDGPVWRIELVSPKPAGTAASQ